MVRQDPGRKQAKKKIGKKERQDQAPADGEVMISARMPAVLIQRLEALRPALAADPKMVMWGRLSRSTLLRIALLRGIESLERRYGRDGL